MVKEIYEATKPKPKPYVRMLEEAIKDETISLEEGDLIRKFIRELGRIDDKRKNVLVFTLVMFRTLMPSYIECVIDDVYQAIDDYRDYTEHELSTQKGRIGMLQQFLTWMVESEINTTLNAVKVSKLARKQNIQPKIKTADDILTSDELQALFQAARNTRDRLFLELMYESGGRLNELTQLKWSQVIFEGGRTMVNLKSKTDKVRTVPLLTSSTTLKLWMKQYPQGWENDAYIFYGGIGQSINRFKPIHPNTGQLIVKRAKSDAGIKKRVHPHIFRHTRITDLLRLGFPEQDIKMFMWGHVKTKMLDVYAHLVASDSVNALYEFYDIDIGDRQSVTHGVITPKTCNNPKCFAINRAIDKFCSICGNPLDKDTKAKRDRAIELIDNHPVFIEKEKASIEAENAVMERYLTEQKNR